MTDTILSLMQPGLGGKHPGPGLMQPAFHEVRAGLGLMTTAMP
jgi:hypothetical protein